MLHRLIKNDAARLVGLLALVLLLALPTLTYPPGRDQGEFATIGRGILNGRVPYTELWNPKPPAIFYLYAGAMQVLGQTSMALRALDFAAVPIISAALWWIGRRLFNAASGWWVALLFPAFYFSETFWTLTQNDGIVLVPMVLAVVCLLKALPEGSGHRTVYALLAGLLCGYVVWFKYPFALFGVWLGLSYIGLRWKDHFPQRQDGLIVAAFLVGGVLTGGGGALLLMQMGAWDEFLLSVRVTAQYTSLTFNPADMGDLMRVAIGYRWAQWGPLIVAAVTGAGLALMNRKTNQPRSRASFWLIVAWLVTGIIIMGVQAKGYDYHWLPTLPALALLAAAGLERLQRTMHARPALLKASNVVLAAVFLGIMIVNIWPRTWGYLSGQQDQASYYDQFVAGAADEFNAGDSLRVATLLRERVAAGDSLYIWGFRPEVYYLSGLNPATRFIFQFPLVGSWYPPEWRDENVETLWAALPPYVLVLQVDYMPWVTGSSDDSNTLLQEYTELNNWLIYNYEREMQIGHFFVWHRKP